MRWILKPIIAPIARRKLAPLYEEQRRIEAAIKRARKSKARVSDLYEIAKRNNLAIHRLEAWLWG